MAQYAEDKRKVQQASGIGSLMSVFMTIAALVYMFVMGLYFPDGPNAPWIVIIPPIALLVGAMWFLVKPDYKVEW